MPKVITYFETNSQFASPTRQFFATMPEAVREIKSALADPRTYDVIVEDDGENVVYHHNDGVRTIDLEKLFPKPSPCSGCPDDRYTHGCCQVDFCLRDAEAAEVDLHFVVSQDARLCQSGRVCKWFCSNNDTPNPDAPCMYCIAGRCKDSTDF